MPLHRTAKGDSPQEALSQLVRRIERSGGTVVQVTETRDEWLVLAAPITSSTDGGWETRA